MKFPPALPCLLALYTAVSAHADTQLKIVTEKGYVAFVAGDDWSVLSMETKPPVATAVFQLPNPADEATPESTNLVLILYDLATEKGRAGFERPLPQYGDEPKPESMPGGWTVYRQSGIQNSTQYTVLDAKRTDIADVAASVRLAWPHLPGNPQDYDARMESTFRAFLESVEGHLGRPR
jgi:hypothetical protein